VDLARRRERRPALWLPYVAMGFFFAAFVRRGEGFAWRYVGDFWPLMVLAAVQYIHTMPADRVRPLHSRTTKVLLLGGLIALAHFLVPWQWSSGGPHGEGRAETVPPRDAARMEDSFRASHSGIDAPLPSRLSCDARPTTPYNNGLGWKD